MTGNSPAWWRRFPPRLDITPSSKLLTGHAAATLALAVGAVFYAQIPLALRFALIAVLAASGHAAWRRYLAPGAPGRVRRLIYSQARGWCVVDGAGTRRRVAPMAASFVQPWLTLLWLRSADGQRYRVALPPVGPQRHGIRRCRVVLRAGTGAWS